MQFGDAGYIGTRRCFGVGQRTYYMVCSCILLPIIAVIAALCCRGVDSVERVICLGVRATRRVFLCRLTAFCLA
jgi:hypothetical protein